MVNPSVTQQLAREYRREDLQAAQARRVLLQLSRHSIRVRLGWSLVGLGARLTRDPLIGTPVHGRHVHGSQRARTSLPLARL